MSTYRMDDGTVVKTEKATQSWEKDTSNYETLYRSRRGRYWVEHTSKYESSTRAEWISNHAAAQWLLANGDELPEDLAAQVNDSRMRKRRRK